LAGDDGKPQTQLLIVVIAVDLVVLVRQERVAIALGANHIPFERWDEGRPSATSGVGSFHREGDRRLLALSGFNIGRYELLCRQFHKSL
jgi:hypothetical protein